MTNPEKVMKLVLVGDSGVGKSSFFLRYCDGVGINEGAASTVGVDIKHKVVELEGKKRRKTMITLQICDTAGQERFGTLTSSLFRAAQGLFVCYDICDRDSFAHATSWRNEIAKYAPKDAVICLIGMKSDLEHKRQVSENDGRTLAETWNVPFFEVSSKNNVNVNEAATTLAQKVSLLKSVETRLVKSPSNIKIHVPRRCTIL